MTISRKFLRRAFFVSFIAFLLLAFELSSYFYLKCCSEIIYPAARHIIDPLNKDWLDRFYRTTFDRELGWVPRANTRGEKINSIGRRWTWSTDEFGARRHGGQAGTKNPAIATYGDSWVFGDEVDDRATWQFHVSVLLDKTVANFGVGGYGTDQALLRFDRTLSQGILPRVAILGVTYENHNRVFSRYRPYYNPHAGIRLGFKPQAYLDDQGELRFRPSELRAPEYDKSILRELAEAPRNGDFWAGFLPRFEFPYSVNLMQGARIRLCGDYPWIPTCDFGGAPNWNRPETRSIMTALVREFVRKCKSNGIFPVLLFFPDRKPPSYALYLEVLRKELSQEGVLVLDFSEAPGYTPSGVSVRRIGGHLSARGNRLVGEYLARQLADLPVLKAKRR